MRWLLVGVWCVVLAGLTGTLCVCVWSCRMRVAAMASRRTAVFPRCARGTAMERGVLRAPDGEGSTAAPEVIAPHGCWNPTYTYPRTPATRDPAASHRIVDRADSHCYPPAWPNQLAIENDHFISK